MVVLRLTVMVWLGTLPVIWYWLTPPPKLKALPLYCTFQPPAGAMRLTILSVTVIVVVVAEPELQRLIWKPKIELLFMTVPEGKASVPLHWLGVGEILIPLMLTISLSEVTRLPTQARAETVLGLIAE